MLPEWRGLANYRGPTEESKNGSKFQTNWRRHGVPIGRGLAETHPDLLNK
jgi:hypothetical protein